MRRPWTESGKSGRIEKKFQINDSVWPEHRLAMRVKRNKIKVNVYPQINKIMSYTLYWRVEFSYVINREHSKFEGWG